MIDKIDGPEELQREQAGLRSAEDRRLKENADAAQARTERIRRAADVADLAERILLAPVGAIIYADPVVRTCEAASQIATYLASAMITERERLRAEAERKP